MADKKSENHHHITRQYQLQQQEAQKNSITKTKLPNPDHLANDRIKNLDHLGDGLPNPDHLANDRIKNLDHLKGTKLTKSLDVEQEKNSPLDDYFDLFGNYLGTDNASTNYIRVIRGSYIMSLEDLEKATLITDIIIDSEQKQKMLSRIMKFYTKKIGRDENIGIKKDLNAIMFTDYEKGNPIKVAMGSDRKLNSKKLKDKFNVMNTLVHEGTHVDKHKKVDVTLGVGSEAHLEAYWEQVTHATWKDTSPAYKKEVIANIIWFIAYIPETNKREYLKEKFQTQLGIVITNWGDSTEKSAWNHE